MGESCYEKKPTCCRPCCKPICCCRPCCCCTKQIICCRPVCYVKRVKCCCNCFEEPTCCNVQEKRN